MIELDSDKWSRKYDECMGCRSISLPHEAHGLCRSCYKRYYNTVADYDKQKFICEYCGELFYNSYMLAEEHKLRFCSKSCATKSRRKFGNKTQLEQAIIKEIKSSGRYLTKDDVLKKLNISSKTLSKLRISIITLNNKCGMRKPKSVFEYKVGCILKDIFPDLLFEKSFECLRSSKGYLLHFDFYSPSNKLAIEADGAQHKGQKYYYKDIGSLIVNDKIKEVWCKNNNICLIRIDYTRCVNKSYIIQSLKPFLEKNGWDNQQRSLATGTFNDQSFDVGSSESKRGRPFVGFDMI